MTDTPDEVTRMAREIAERHYAGVYTLAEWTIAALREALLTRLPISEDEALQRAREAVASCEEEYGSIRTAASVRAGECDGYDRVQTALHALTHAHIPLEPPKPKDDLVYRLRSMGNNHRPDSPLALLLWEAATRLEQKGGEA